jgi:hypothetical protein
MVKKNNSLKQLQALRMNFDEYVSCLKYKKKKLYNAFRLINKKLTAYSKNVKTRALKINFRLIFTEKYTINKLKHFIK